MTNPSEEQLNEIALKAAKQANKDQAKLVKEYDNMSKKGYKKKKK